MRQILAWEELDEVLQTIRADLQCAQLRRVSVYNIAFLCKSGRHRSVAIAKYMALLVEALGLKLGDHRHLSRNKWRRDFCTRCPACGPHQTRSQLGEGLFRRFVPSSSQV